MCDKFHHVHLLTAGHHPNVMEAVKKIENQQTATPTTAEQRVDANGFKILKVSCTNCRIRHKTCNGEVPCSLCVYYKTEKSCVYPMPKKAGRKRLKTNGEPDENSNKLVLTPDVMREIINEGKVTPEMVDSLRAELAALQIQVKTNNETLQSLSSTLSLVIQSNELQRAMELERIRPAFTELSCILVKHRVIYPNYKLCELLGYSQSEMEGLQSRVLMHPETLLRKHRDVCVHHLQSEFFMRRMIYIRKDQTCFEADVTYHRFSDITESSIAVVMCLHPGSIVERPDVAAPRISNYMRRGIVIAPPPTPSELALSKETDTHGFESEQEVITYLTDLHGPDSAIFINPIDNLDVSDVYLESAWIRETDFFGAADKYPSPIYDSESLETLDLDSLVVESDLQLDHLESVLNIKQSPVHEDFTDILQPLLDAHA